MDSSLNIPRKVESAQIFPWRCSYSKIFFFFFYLVPWLHRYLAHLCSQDDGCDALRMHFSSQLLAHWHCLLPLPSWLWSPISKSPHTDHLELLGSAARYLISNMDWPNIHPCQWHIVHFQSVPWSGTQASPRFQPSTVKLQNTAPLQQPWV